MKPLLLGLFALMPVLSLARPAAAADEASPEELLRAGVKLRHEHLDEAALALFQRAETMAPTPVAVAQVALAEQALGRWLDAEVHLRGALQANQDAWIIANRAGLDLAGDEIAKHLAWLTVDVSVPSAEVRFDGHPITPFTETRLVASSGPLDVRAPGYAPFLERVDIAPGDHDHRTITLTSLHVDPPADRPHGAAPSHARSLGPLVLAAFATAGIGVGTYFGVLTFVQKAARDAQCHNGVCQEAAAADDTSARESAQVSTVAFTAGLALGAGALVWWLLDAPAPRPRAGWRVVPMASAKNVGVSLLGRLP